MKGTKNGYTRDLIEHIGLFFCKVAYSIYDVPLSLLQTKITKPFPTPVSL
jgi:hypothetical protein